MTTGGHETPRLHQIADETYAYVQPDGGWWINNTGFIVGENGVVSIDTCSTERRTHAYQRAISSVTDQPVRTVVNTHHHGDHTHGNYLFRPASIIGHRECRREILRFGLPRTDGVFTPVEWGGLEIEAPSITFSDRLDLFVGDLRIELHHIGPAHTTNDVVAWIPDGRVLFAGDLIFNGGTPFILMGSLAGSLEALSRLRSFEAETIVPGHGPVCTPDVIEDNRRYLEFVDRTAHEAFGAGLSPNEAARQLDLGWFSQLTDPERIVGNLHRAYAELRGAEPGQGIDVPAAFGDMIRFNGGKPLRCHA
jgi:cyclase